MTNPIEEIDEQLQMMKGRLDAISSEQQKLAVEEGTLRRDFNFLLMRRSDLLRAIGRG